MQIVSRQPSDVATPRIGSLSILPVFLDLIGKRAIVAGGTAAAAWKAELLIAAGASTEIFARPDELSAEMIALSEREPALRLFGRSWSIESLQGAAVAIADVGSDHEAAAFKAAAEGVGTLCNVIDRKDFCHFQFGTIVNRSPVVVGISTSGAAPILAQAIRRRIETVLPPSLAQWSVLARDWRERVVAKLQTGKARRAFWERFVDLAFGPAPDQSLQSALSHALKDAARLNADGHVTFVGAGPGDAELLTLKAMRALQSADVILFDDLVSNQVLELARREAKRILVGKRAGRPSCKQHEINDMMIRLAKAGRRVVRLKSGDPMIFGRAGEEIEALEAQGIAFDVVPGITSGLAMAARLGVSLTHRDCARSVRFVTGHSKNGGLPADIDWSAITDPLTTTIFYMGGRTADQISLQLMQHGLSPDAQVAIGIDVGRATEQLRYTELADLPAAIATLGRDSPVLIGVGRVFRRGVEGQRQSMSSNRQTKELAARRLFTYPLPLAEQLNAQLSACSPCQRQNNGLSTTCWSW